MSNIIIIITMSFIKYLKIIGNKKMMKDINIDQIFSNSNENVFNEKLEIPTDFYKNVPPDRISIAPMLNITNKHFRYLMRLITKKTYLWTEMINANTIIYKEKELEYEYNFENPVVLQLGGNNVNELSKCAEIAKKYNYNEINLNCGCPSNKVQNHNFGACLMKDPELVKSCLIAVKNVIDIPITVKCRLGLDKYCEEFLDNFISTIVEKVNGVSYCDHIILHSRIALMNLDTVKNRSIPPLMYDEVRRIKRKFPKIKITINGGFTTKKQILDELTNIIEIKNNNELNEEIKNLKIDCVMIGREAYNNPFMFADFDSFFYNEKNIGLNREEILIKYAKYCQREYEKFVLPSILLKPIINLFHGEKHNSFYRNKIFEFKKTFKEMDELKNKNNQNHNYNNSSLDLNNDLDNFNKDKYNDTNIVIENENKKLKKELSIEEHIISVLEEFKKLNPDACLKSY